MKLQKSLIVVWQVGVGMLVAMEPLEAVVLILPIVCKVLCPHLIYIWNSFENNNRIINVLDQKIEEFIRIST